MCVLNVQDAIPEPKTKLVTAGLTALGIDLERQHTLLIVSSLFTNLKLASRNIDRLTVNTIDCLNAYDILRADKIVVERSALKYIQVPSLLLSCPSLILRCPFFP